MNAMNGLKKGHGCARSCSASIVKYNVRVQLLRSSAEDVVEGPQGWDSICSSGTCSSMGTTETDAFWLLTLAHRSTSRIKSIEEEEVTTALRWAVARCVAVVSASNLPSLKLLPGTSLDAMVAAINNIASDNDVHLVCKRKVLLESRFTAEGLRNKKNCCGQMIILVFASHFQDEEPLS